METEINLAQLFRNRAAMYSDRVRWRQAAGGQQMSVTWRENQRLVNKLIVGLDALGARPGDVIGILGSTRWEWLAADWAITGLGAACVTLYPSNTDDTCAFILNDSGACYVFADDAEQYAKLRGIREALPNIRKVILFDDAEHYSEDDWVISFDTLQMLSQRSPEDSDAFVAERAAAIQPGDLFTLVYTSGTTGQPKGVPHTHGGFMAQLGCVKQTLTAIKPGMVDLLFLPLSHVFGREQHLAAYDLGLETVICTSLDTLAADIREAHPDLLFSVPRVYEKAYAAIQGRVEKGSGAQRRIFAWACGVGIRVAKLREQRKAIPATLALRYRLADRLVFHKVREALGGNLKFAISSAAPLDLKILEFFNGAGVLLLEGWGMTETSGGFCLNTPECYRMGTVGKVYPGHEMRFAEDGEILVRGPCVFTGYRNNPETNANSFDADSWFYTGDIGRVDEDGFVRIVDRKKDLIITAGGKNIAPQLVENTLKQMALVSQVCVYGDRKPYLVALITLDPAHLRQWATDAGIAYDESADSAGAFRDNPKLRAYLDEQLAKANSKLASYETVKYYALLPEDFTVENGLLTPTLKIRRRQIYQRYDDLFNSLYRPMRAEAGIQAG